MKNNVTSKQFIPRESNPFSEAGHTNYNIDIHEEQQRVFFDRIELKILELEHQIRDVKEFNLSKVQLLIA